MIFEELINHIKSNIGEDFIEGLDEQCSPKAVVVSAEKLLRLMGFLHADKECYFDSLSCITGLDNGVEKASMEVIYNLYSIPYNHHLTVKVNLGRAKPEIDSVTSVWKAADWHEREAYDLLGIHFEGHPDLRRILLPADWEGHPLRKDYKHQEYYRGIKVEY
ncbi:MAG: NADH-quinone oxidoreductase subunit C [Roseivirga sp.]|nr:NADH-quinone oxidoreductase subunit C [Roseivirga sp.]